MIEGTLTSMNGHVGDSVAVDVVAWNSPVNGGGGIGHIGEANSLWFAHTFQ